MVLLLAVGLAAVIIVILIAVFLSVRLGRSDDREEPTSRSSERSEGRADTDDSRWRDERAPRRPPAGAAGPGRGGRPRPEGGDRPYRDRGPERGQAAARSEDYDYPQRRPGPYDTGPVEQPTDPRRLAPAEARRGGPRGGNGTRRAGTGRGRPEAASAPYDTGPSPHAAADEFPSGPLQAADFPSGEFPSRPQPAADFPSGGFPPPASAATGAPHAGYATGDSGEFPPVPSAADFASGEFPAADFPSDEFPAADFPSGEMPAARGRGKSAPPKAGRGQDGPDKRRRSGKGQGASKGRSRQQRKRDDDDDWPSTDWDKLTDEQYWAQLSSDKPLATNARSTQSASKPAPAPSGNGNGNGQPRPAAVRATP